MGGVDSNGVGTNHIQQAGGTHTETLLVLIKQLHDYHNRYQRQQQRDSKQPPERSAKKPSADGGATAPL